MDLKIGNQVHDKLHNINGKLHSITESGIVYVIGEVDGIMYESRITMLTDINSGMEEIHNPARYRIGNTDWIEIASKIIDANDMNGIEAINTFNMGKYVVRWKQKTPRASLLKIIEYAKRQLDEIKAHPENYLEG